MSSESKFSIRCVAVLKVGGEIPETAVMSWSYKRTLNEEIIFHVQA
jgi:hypothetical protein